MVLPLLSMGLWMRWCHSTLCVVAAGALACWQMRVRIGPQQCMSSGCVLHGFP